MGVEGKRATPEAIIEQVLLESLPPNVPPSFAKVLSTEYLRRGKHPIINAELEMFDGKPAAVQCVAWSYGSLRRWSHQWIKLDGGDLSWNGQKWQRIKTTNERNILP